MRQYQPVWEQIKATGSCIISAHRAYHMRIKKAVVKEKDADLLYKMQCLELNPPTVAKLKSKQKGSVISFTLVIGPLISVDTI